MNTKSILFVIMYFQKFQGSNKNIYCMLTYLSIITSKLHKMYMYICSYTLYNLVYVIKTRYIIQVILILKLTSKNLDWLEFAFEN